MLEKEKNKKEIKIKINDEQAKGSYANFMKVYHNSEEFVLDFANIVPPTGIITSRIIVSPKRLKQMISVLEGNLKLYEEKFGEIKQKESDKEKKEIGFNL